jgi:hypothetical protein
VSELEKLQNESADAAKVEVEEPGAPAAGEAAPVAARGKASSAEKAADEDAPASADVATVSAPMSNESTTDEVDSGKAVSDSAPADGAAARKKRRWPKRVALVLVIVVFLGAMGFGAYTGNYYHAGDEAEAELAAWEAGDIEAAAALASEAGATGSTGATTNGNATAAANAASNSPATASQYVTASETSSAITVGSAQSEYGLVIYPGAKVDPAAYVPLACKLASQGVYCIIAKMPFNFAFFDMDAAGDLMSAASYVKHWWISGHSLGGVMAAYYAASNTDKFEGIALLAAYSTANLADSGLKTLVIYGTEDGVLNKSKLADNTEKLPADTQTLVIEGGNHAGYADYGPQQKDGEATISADDQQQQTVNAIAAAMFA